MYIKALMKYQLHQGYMFRPWNNHHQAAAENIQGTIQACTLILCTLVLYLVYVLHWPDDGCFTAETCSADVADISSMRWYTYVVF